MKYEIPDTKCRHLFTSQIQFLKMVNEGYVIMLVFVAHAVS